MKIQLVREIPLKEDCTLGVLRVNDLAICCTLELPWVENKHNISCIPRGTYKTTRYTSPSKGKVFLLHNVPNRSMIEIHIGNTADDILGCILVGRTFGKYKNKRAVLNSGDTLKRLLRDLPLEFDLEIV